MKIGFLGWTVQFKKKLLDMTFDFKLFVAGKTYTVCYKIIQIVTNFTKIYKIVRHLSLFRNT